MLERGFQIADAIVSLIKGRISAEELSVLDTWIDESEENRKLFLRLVDEQVFLQKKKEMALVDTDFDYMNVLEKGRERKMRINIWKISSVAAIICMVIGGMVFWQNSQVDERDLLSVKHERFSANLHLASGEEIVLSELVGDTTIFVKDAEKVVFSEGQILVEESGKNKNRSVQYHELDIPHGHEYYLVLDDGSKIWMNSDSYLKFPDRFTEDGIRKVELYGEAYFEVAKDSLRPFVVKTPEAEIKVLGTTFNVQFYKDKPLVTTLTSGRVEIVVGDNKSVELNPGQQAVTFNGVTLVKDVDTYYYTAWKDGYFMFRDVPLKEIVGVLCNWYGMHYEFSDSWLENIRLTARLKKYDDIDSIVKVLSKRDEFNIKRDNNILLIEKNK